MNTSLRPASSGVLPSQTVARTEVSQAPLESSTRWAVTHSRSLVCLTVAAVALAQANCFRSGNLDYVASGLLALSIVACCCGLNALRQNALASNPEANSPWLAKLLRVMPGLARLATLHPLWLVLWLPFLALLQVVNAAVMLDSMTLQLLRVSDWPALFLAYLP